MSEIRDYDKQCWRTPPEVFAALDDEFGFKLDVAASGHNALCESFITEEQNALSCGWESSGAIWCNPPYSNIAPWVKKAGAECARQCRVVVMLLPCDTSTGWFNEARKTADEMRIITGGRLAFVHPEIKRSMSGNSKGSVLFVWRPYRAPAHIVTYVSRDWLMNRGKYLMMKREENNGSNSSEKPV